MENLELILKELHLNDKEIQIYSFLLGTGCSPISHIAKQVGINRTTCYSYVNNLRERGFVSQIERNKTNYVMAVDPQIWIENLDLKQNFLLKKLNQLRAEIKCGETIYFQKTHKQKVQFFEGKSGLINVLMDILNSGDEMRCYVSSNFKDFIDEAAPYFKYERVKRNIHAKAIFTLDKLPVAASDDEFRRESRFLSGQYDLGITFLVYGNKYALISVKEQIGLIVESEMISKALRRLFNWVWGVARRPRPA